MGPRIVVENIPLGILTKRVSRRFAKVLLEEFLEDLLGDKPLSPDGVTILTTTSESPETAWACLPTEKADRRAPQYYRQLLAYYF